MIILSASEQKVVERLLAKRLETSKAKANKTLLKLVDEGFGLRSIDNNIIYSEKDFDHLEMLVASQTISNDDTSLNTLHASSNRLEIAKHRRNEKWGQATVFAEQILIVGMGCPIPLITKDSSRGVLPPTIDNTQLNDMQPTPIGVLPTVLSEYLDVSRFEKVIIIENGQLLTHWWLWRYKLPADWQNALLLYRGHGGNLAWLLAILPKLPTDCEVLLSFDIDLSGLQMMDYYAKLCHCHVATLIPQWIVKTSSSDTMGCKLPSYNQPHKITQQLDTVNVTSLSAPLRPIYHTLKKYQIALMQEHLWQDDRIDWVEVSLQE